MQDPMSLYVNMNEPRAYRVKWNKPGTKLGMFYTYLCNMEQLFSENYGLECKLAQPGSVESGQMLVELHEINRS
jgi:hypothetical protein